MDTDNFANFDAVFERWARTKRYTPDVSVLASVRQRVEEILDAEGGYVSVSHFERAYLELLKAGEIPEFHAPAPVQQAAAPIDFTTMTIAEIRRKYANDANFRAQYDQSNGRGGGANVPRTAAEYNRLSTSETIRRYGSEPAFKAAIDQLVAEGKI